MDDYSPQTDSGGSLIPPPRSSPTAVATSSPLLPGRPSLSRSPARIRGLRGLVESLLDRLDTFGDRIADAAGLR
jgi:hypothetical protein